MNTCYIYSAMARYIPRFGGAGLAGDFFGGGGRAGEPELASNVSQLAFEAFFGGAGL